MTMTKRDLVREVADKVGATQSSVATIVEEAFSVIARALADGQRWELRDFGVFSVRTRASRVGRNPRTGELVSIPARRVVVFRSGKMMTDLAASSPIRHEEKRAERDTE